MGSPLEEKVYIIIKKKNNHIFSCCSDFSLFSLRFPVGFNQTQARFTSLVNLEIFFGKKNCLFFFFFSVQRERKGGFCQAGFPKFS